MNMGVYNPRLEGRGKPSNFDSRLPVSVRTGYIQVCGFCVYLFSKHMSVALMKLVLGFSLSETCELKSVYCVDCTLVQSSEVSIAVLH